MSSVPLFAPDGSVRQVPAEQLTDALNAGGKRAVQMTDPSGTLRYVPEDQVNTAMQSGGKVYQPAPSFWQDPKSFLQTRAGQMGQEAQNQMNQALGPESQGKSLLSRMGHATLSYLPATAQVIDKAASGLVGTDAGTWKNAAMVAAGAMDPALPGAYFATQGTGQLTGLTPGVNPGDLSPGNVQNALLAGASVAGGASAAGTSNAGATLKAGPPIAREAIKTANTVLNKAPELVLGGAGAAVGGAVGGGYGAGIGGTFGAILGKTLPKMGRIPGDNFGLPTTAAPDPTVAQSQPLSSVPTPQTIPAAQSGEALGQIRSTQAAPQPANVQAPVSQVPQAPFAQQPAPMLQLDPVDGSSQIAAHGYNPETQTAQVQFRNGQIHEYQGVTPEDWDNYRAQPSPGKGFQAYIKKNPQTGQGRLSRPLTARSAKSTVEPPPASPQELLDRYVGLY
ncbi:MAG TPA: KTSC domain-containing protein [Terriglobales bacterium]|jgi:hypothetical protein|nr:KTSC domain-containing protein [Terriglobales bacterium]